MDEDLDNSNTLKIFNGVRLAHKKETSEFVLTINDKSE